jgi:hypothetical protein
MVLQAGQIASEHWNENLTARERSRLRKLLQKSRGLPSNLTAKEREEIKHLALKLDPVGAGRKLLPFAGRGRKGRR